MLRDARAELPGIQERIRNCQHHIVKLSTPRRRDPPSIRAVKHPSTSRVSEGGSEGRSFQMAPKNCPFLSSSADTTSGSAWTHAGG